ncbi:MAG: hypothetical protein A2V90_04400 [Gammaproteobacteria bacterium RBG_16_57_12]|nr:MAG: hypothetical protein A2V90_04400 [Gammaproteobacteria bacterium RBG_16_57_12]
MIARKQTIVSAVFTFAVFLFGLAPAAHANLMVNGSFEIDNFGPSHKLGLVGNDVTGWFIPSLDGVYPWGLQNVNIFGGGPAADGNQWLVLGEVSTGVEYTIQQTLNGLVPGSIYNLSFALASESGCCSTAEVSFLSGSSTAPQSFVAPSSGQWWTQWGAYSMNFLADVSSVTLQFKNINLGPGIDLGLDNVIVEGASIPEPATLALMGLGLAGIGFRRKLQA